MLASWEESREPLTDAVPLAGEAHADTTSAVREEPRVRARPRWLRRDDERNEAGAVECVAAAAAALELVEDPTALSVAELALGRCFGLADAAAADLRRRILAQSGRIRVARHDWAGAIRRLSSALGTRCVVHDVALDADVHANLALAHLGAGDPGTGFAWAVDAARRRSFVRDPLASVPLDVKLALALIRCGRLDDADVLVAGAAMRTDGFATYGPSILLARAELQCRVARYSDALEAATAAAEAARRLGLRLTLATAHERLGAIGVLAGELDLADAQLEAAIAILQTLDVPFRLAECHAQLGALLDERDEVWGALDHWKQAALLLNHGANGGGGRLGLPTATREAARRRAGS